MNSRRSFFSSLLAAACVPLIKFFPAPEKPKFIDVSTPWVDHDVYDDIHPPELYKALESKSPRVEEVLWLQVSDCDRAAAQAGITDPLNYRINKYLEWAAKQPKSHYEWMNAFGPLLPD